MTAQTIPATRELRAKPWRFHLGNTVFIRNRPTDARFVVVGGELWVGFPHLKVRDEQGKTWLVSQLECSSKPISYRKG